MTQEMQKKMKIVFGNYGNPTIAVMQWLHAQSIQNIYVISVETQWADPAWAKRVEAGQNLAKTLGYQTVRLQSPLSFADLIRDRRDFPSTKFQWCAGFLKGLPLLDWLDEHDPECEATIILGKRRADSRANFDLPEYIEASEHYGDRRVWYPLYDTDDTAYEALICTAEMEKLPHRSLECDPCVNSFGADLARIDHRSISRTQDLEQEVGKTLFEFPIEDMVKQARKNHSQPQTIEMFNMGCGSPYACGE